MIVQITIDTDTDMEMAKRVFRELGYEEMPMTVRTCANVYEAARRRTAGEAVVCTDKPAPKKRGRKPKNFNKE